MQEEEEITEINDVRGNFKGIAFSNFKLTDVRKELLTNLTLAKIEPSCYWSAELICSGHLNELWDLLFFFYSKYIHIGNLKIAIYLEKRMHQFKAIVHNGYQEDELRLRNNARIRHLFAEIVCVLCNAKRTHCFEAVNIKRQDFDITRIGDILKAPHANFAEEFFRKADPKELFVGINEFCFHLSEESKNAIQACFWLEWMLEFEVLCKRNHVSSRMKCDRREEMPVPSKHQMDIIWILWEILAASAQQRSAFVQKTMQALLHLFCLCYVPGVVRKRKFLLYFAVSLICENAAILVEAAKEEIVREDQKPSVAIILKNMDMVYKQIKKNEQSPNTDYLFTNLKNTNLEQTIQKLEAIESFDSTYTPRVEECT